MQQIIKKHKEAVSVADRKGRDRKKWTTPRKDRMITKQSLKARMKTYRMLANKLRNYYSINVTSRTIRRLVNSGL